MMRIVEIINGIPYLIVVVLLMMVLPKGIFTMVVAYATVGWTGMARLVRGQCLSLKNQEFVVAAEAMGARASRIIGKHLLPNTPVGHHYQRDPAGTQRHLYRGVPVLHWHGRTGTPALLGHAGPGKAPAFSRAIPGSCGFPPSPSA